MALTIEPGVNLGPGISLTAPPPAYVTSGLLLFLDAGNPLSYPASGTTWYDISGNGNNATWTPGSTAPTYSTVKGGGFVFNNSIMTIPNSSSMQPGTNSWTVELWMAWNGVYSGGQGCCVIGSINTPLGDQANGWSVYPGGGSQWSAHYGDGISGIGSYNGASNGTRIATSGQIQNWTITLDKTTGSHSINYYLNGVLDFNHVIGGVPGAITQTAPVYIGGMPPISSYFIGGTIYAIRVYNTVLSNAQRLLNYTSLRTRFGI